jgi:tRNA (cytidine32/uridine32-2'-O)-methyltransferase
METSLFEKLRIVLVETSHPGNIGAAARAMKTMGLSRLYLVNPGLFPSADATARASGADDILARAQVCGSLQEALADCSLAVGTSARQRRIPWPLLQADECAQQAVEHPGEVALVFGREHSGLNNDELAQCQLLVTINTEESFSSLNLGSAVQVLSYEYRKAVARVQCMDTTPLAGHKDKQIPPATLEQMEAFYAQMEQAMIELDFYDPDNPRKLMLRLRRLFNRARLDHNEMQIMRGFITAVRVSVEKN